MDVKKLADLAKLKVDHKEEEYFKKQFEETLKIIDEFKSLDTSSTQQTYSVTGTKNVLREDQIDSSRVLSQEDALSNTKQSHKGFFVVEQIISQK